MRLAAIACCLLSFGCVVQMKHRFVRTDRSFTPSPRDAQPKVVEQGAEVKDEALYRCVGVVEVQMNEHDTLQTFLARVTDAGADAGCELLIQTDQFELRARHNLISREQEEPPWWLPSRWWYANDAQVFQFLCGVGPATEGEATQTLEQANQMAAQLRSAELSSRFR
jgi:hypothetical protein